MMVSTGNRVAGGRGVCCAIIRSKVILKFFTMKHCVFPCFLFTLILFWSCESASRVDSEGTSSPTQYVDPFIGTAEHGHVYPGATVPFGGVQLSPDNGTGGWDWCAGYNWADSLIVGFSHTHLSGTGIGDLYDLSFMPVGEQLDFSVQPPPRESKYAASFSHDQEEASPGYYAVRLDNGIEVALTATTRVGVHQYAFPSGSPVSVLVDLGFSLNWDSPTKTQLKVDKARNRLTGYRFSTGWARDQRVYFAAEFSRPIAGFQLADTTQVLSDVVEAEGERLRTQLFFDEEDAPLLIKVGISTASEAGAIAALAEVPGWDFERVRNEAKAAWEKELQKIKIATGDEALKKVFYTALYRTSLAPVVMSDPNGEYKGADGEVHRADGYTRYDIFSLWDTFRAAHPLFTFTQPERINDFIRSMLAHYDEHGLLPVWSLLGNETNTMTGYHAIPVIADAYFKGFRDYDVEKAYRAMKASGMQDIRGVNFYKEYGYIPSDLEVESVTKNLEYAYDDWCIAQMAQDLGYEEDYRYFMERAASYRQLFDADTGFMRGKMADGSWRAPFDPRRSEHRVNTDYTEGNAWQHSWFVPHDVAGLIDLHGGPAPFVRKLDSLFLISSEITGEHTSADISGLIGQYAHGNEPSHHIAYLYNYAGQPWKTQETVHEILTTQYDATPAGLCGNEDCGQMSAWYVFSALGFYPVNPAEGVYQLGSPLFESAEMQLPGDRIFRIEAPGVSPENRYIQSARLNGRDLERPYLTHEEIMSGGELILEMGAEPDEGLWAEL